METFSDKLEFPFAQFKIHKELQLLKYNIASKDHSSPQTFRILSFVSLSSLPQFHLVRLDLQENSISREVLRNTL